MRRVVRAVAAAAHAEGGCAIRELCGVRRLLDAAATHLSPAEGALDLDPIGGGKGESSTDSPAPSAPAPEASIRAFRGSVRGASTEDKLALMDELVAAVSTLAHGGQSSRGGADETALAANGDCIDAVTAAPQTIALDESDEVRDITENTPPRDRQYLVRARSTKLA